MTLESDLQRFIAAVVEDARERFWDTFGEEGWQAYQRGFFPLLQWCNARPDLGGIGVTFGSSSTYWSLQGRRDILHHGVAGEEPVDGLLQAIMAYRRAVAQYPCTHLANALDYPWPEPGEADRPHEVSVCPPWRLSGMVDQQSHFTLVDAQSEYCERQEVRCEAP